MIPMWAPFLFLCLVCLLPARCDCRKGAIAPGCPRHDPEQRKS